MQITDYEESLLRFVESDTPTESDILNEFEGVLIKGQLKSVIRALKDRRYIKPQKILISSFTSSDGTDVTSTADVYALTPLGKNYLANTTPNFTSFSNINNSNIASNSSNVKQKIDISGLPQDLTDKLAELEAAVKSKDSNAIKNAFTYILDKSVDLAVQVPATGLFISK